MDKFPAAHPKEERGQGHENTGDAEGEVGAVPLEQPGGEEHGNQGTEVDGEVEPIEDFGEEVGVPLAELVSDVGGDAGFDSPGAEADQGEAEDHPDFCLALDPHEGEGGVPEAVDDGEGDDGPVFAKEDVADECSEEGGEIDPTVEEVHGLGGRGFGHGAVRGGVHEVQILHHEDGEDALHAVEGEALRGLVTDDVGDASRDPGVLGVGGSAVGHGNGKVWKVVAGREGERGGGGGGVSEECRTGGLIRKDRRSGSGRGVVRRWKFGVGVPLSRGE